MELTELDAACITLFGKPSTGYGITPKLAKLCKCSQGAVRKWKERGRVSAPAAEIIRARLRLKVFIERVNALATEELER